MMLKFAAAATLVLLPSLAFAGNFENGLYTSNLDYQIRPPENWTRLDASNASAMSGHVPDNIQVSGTDRFDVIFFPEFSNTDTSKKADDERLAKNKEAKEANKPDEIKPPIVDSVTPPEFVPSVSVLVISEVPSVQTPEIVKAYEKKLIESHDGFSYADSFQVLNATKETAYAEDAFLFKFSFNYNRREIDVEQALMFHLNSTYVITCTSDAQEPVNNDKKWCRSVITSIKFKN